jgi:hypothetical protein
MNRHSMIVDRRGNSTVQYLIKRRHKQEVFAMLYVCCFCTEFKINVSGVKEIFIQFDTVTKKGHFGEPAPSWNE